MAYIHELVVQHLQNEAKASWHHVYEAQFLHTYLALLPSFLHLITCTLNLFGIQPGRPDLAVFRPIVFICFRKQRKSFFHGESYAFIFTKNVLGYLLGDFFPQTNQVTLDPT
jgi:hypothetical protein